MQVVFFKVNELGKGHTMVEKVQHYLNPLHVYCRMRNCGMPKRPARFLGEIYERIIFKYLAGIKKGIIINDNINK